MKKEMFMRWNKTSEEYKELMEIKEMVDRLNETRIKFFKDRVYCEKRADEFLEKHSKGVVLGNYTSYLGGMSRDDLFKSLENKEKVDDILSILNHSGRNIGSVNTNDFSLESVDRYYKGDNRLIEKYGEFVDEMDSIELDIEEEDLDYGMYLVDGKLESSLMNGWRIKRDRWISRSDKDSFYVVVFNVLKVKSKSILIYNYIQYNRMFLKLFYVYGINMQMAMLKHGRYVKGSSYFFLLEDVLTEGYTELNKVRNSRGEVFELYEKESLIKPINIIDLLKVLVKGRLICKSVSYMTEVVGLLYQEEYKRVLESLMHLNPDFDYNQLVKSIKDFKACNRHVYNKLSRFVFIVSDLERFLNSIKRSSGSSLNAGSQKFRGGSCYINNILNNLDKGFRSSMYNHNRTFALKGYGSLIPRTKFGYTNIHCNLGYARW